jgi:uncharacterized membrane protein
MSDEQKVPPPEKTSDLTGLWLAIGAGVGTLLGIVFNNILMGVTFGIALGLVFGAALSQKSKK